MNKKQKQAALERLKLHLSESSGKGLLTTLRGPDGKIVGKLVCHGKKDIIISAFTDRKGNLTPETEELLRHFKIDVTEGGEDRIQSKTISGVSGVLARRRGPKSSIIIAPGYGVQRFLARFVSTKTVERVLDPARADDELDYFAAVDRNDPWSVRYWTLRLIIGPGVLVVGKFTQGAWEFVKGKVAGGQSGDDDSE